MKKNLYNSIIGQLTKKGKKDISLNILNKALFEVSLKTNFTISKILRIISLRLGSVVETKTVRLRKNVHVIPFPLKSSRRFYLIAKNIINSVNENVSKIPVKEKIIEEIFSIIRNKQSKSLQKKSNILKQATNNKSNVHYRW